VSVVHRFHIPVSVLTISMVVFAAATVVAAKNGTDTIGTVVPDHDIHYTNENSLPRWKIDWDRARALYRQGKAGQALVQYELLLQKKGTIDEARWEYASILIQQKRWRQAGKQLDILLAHDADNRRYLLARAGVSLHEGRVKQAVQQYGELFESCPDGPDALQALRGFIDALEKQGNREAQLPLLELLLLRTPEDFTLLKRTGALALALGKPEKTKNLLLPALDKHSDDAGLMKLLARTEDALHDSEKAAEYWQQLVALEPDDIYANAWLAKYYLKKGNTGMALLHVERQLKIDPINADLILQAAHLHKERGRHGKALDYLSLYLELVPADSGVRQERERIRGELSDGLIALLTGKKDNIEHLWRDVGTMSRDREGVFLHLADQLRKNGEKEKRTDVLLFLHRRLPSDKHIYQELVPLLREEGRMDELNAP